MSTQSIYANVEMARLTLAFSHLQVAVFKMEPNVKQTVKRDLTNCINFIERADGILKRFLTPEQLALMQQDTISDDTAIAACRIIYEYLSLPAGIRDHVEKYVQSQYSVYANNKK